MSTILPAQDVQWQMQLAAEDNAILPGPSNETMTPPLSVSLFEH